MTEMQWVAKPQNSTLLRSALPYSLHRAERVVVMECLDLTVFLFAGIFFSVFLSSS